MNKQYTDEEIRQQVTNFYDNIAVGKTSTEVNSIDLYKSLGYDPKLLEKIPEEVSSGLSCGNPLDNLVLKDTDTLLDLGCGMGLDVFMARITYPNSNTIYGMDRLESMIQKAIKVRDKKGFKNIEFIQGELIDMPFEDNSIDKIISNCVINLEPNKQKVYQEIHRILKPNGMFIISDITLKKQLNDDILSLDNIYGSWVGGALLEEDVKEIIKKAGFTNFFAKSEEVTDTYAKKWGYGLKIKEFIQETMFIGNK